MRKKNGRMLLLATAVALSVAACGNKAATSTETESSMAQGEAPSAEAPDGKGGPGGAPGGAPGGSSSDIEYKGAAEITSASSTSAVASSTAAAI